MRILRRSFSRNHKVVAKRLAREIDILRKSPLLDLVWYSQAYTDLFDTPLDVARHYVEYGANEGRNPNPLFDTKFYIQKNPDVAACGMNPLVHYILYGAKEGRDPHPLFDSSFYMRQNTEVLASDTNPLLDYIQQGKKRSLRPHPLFDAQYYLEQNPDVAASGANPLVHYLLRGAKEGRNPHHLFDTRWYLIENPQLAESNVNPLIHFLTHGANDELSPGPRFSTKRYLQKYPDVAQSGMNPLVHYVYYGEQEGRHIFLSEDKAQSEATALEALKSGAGETRDFAILFVSGEPHTPGHSYRILRYVDAAKANGIRADWLPIGDLGNNLNRVMFYDVMIIWRATWNEVIESAIQHMHSAGKRVVFDVDDLMVDPEFARISIIDGIRTQHLTESDVRHFYGLVRQTMLHADLCSCTTQELAFHMRKTNKSTFVLPNGFDQLTHDVSRLAAKEWRRDRDGIVRIGYAGGSKTHQRDLGLAIDAIAKLLSEDSNCRLVLFYQEDANGTNYCVDITEYPALISLHGQIEWRRVRPLQDLPNEIARFDVNLAPLEIGNDFCEAKSELKFFEAALVNVPTVASPTGPFRRAIDHGKTGYLAVTSEDWYNYIRKLIDNPTLRNQIAERAYHKSLALFGPRRRALQFGCVLDQFRGGACAARGFALDALLSSRATQIPKIFPSDIIFDHDTGGLAEVTVVIPLYNYETLVCEALDSVYNQTIDKLDVVIVDGCSSDASLAVATSWAEKHFARFNRIAVLKNRANYGLGYCRNSGFSAADTAYVLLLDADNRLLPRCCERLLDTIKRSNAAFAYPTIQQFGDTTVAMSDFPYEPQRFVFGNYIDAMALVSKEAWAIAGGIEHVQYGWEDYDFWCRLAEIGLFGEWCPETLAEYRVHKQSMVRTHTTIAENYKKLHRTYSALHPWVFLSERQLHKMVPSGEPDGISSQQQGRLNSLLPLLRCPVSKEKLAYHKDGKSLVSLDGFNRWPVIKGIPCLTANLEAPMIMPESHISNEISGEALTIIRESKGFVLNLSAGGSRRKFDNVVEVEHAVFRHTDIVADAHELPFDDEIFEAVIVMNAFEHYRNPGQVSAEIHRVLKPGGTIYIMTAFLQPLHEKPYHFYNCTKYGMAEWFTAFETKRLGVSTNFCPNHTVAWILSECESALRADVSNLAADRFCEASVGSFVAMWRDPSLRSSTLWTTFHDISQSKQEVTAAGFELVAHRPLSVPIPR